MEKQIQGRLNAKREEFFKYLKEKGKYVGYCEKRGYLYQLIGPIYGKYHRILIAIKGNIKVLKVSAL